MNIADLLVVLVLAGLLLFGMRNGLIGQILLLGATLLSVLAAAVVAYVVGAQDEMGSLARLAAPIAFFVALGLASWLFRMVAQSLTVLVHRLPLASLDRLLGAVLALIVGALILSVLLLGILNLPVENPLTRTVGAARSTPWLLDVGWHTTRTGARFAAVLEPLAQRFEEARSAGIVPAL